MIDLNDAERVGAIIGEWQPQRLSAAADSAKLVSREFTDDQLETLDIPDLVDRLVLHFALPTVNIMNLRSSFSRHRDGRAGGIFVIPLETSARVAAALRYRGAFHEPVPQLYVLPAWHQSGPAILFEFDDPKVVEHYDRQIRSNVDSLNVTLLVRASSIQEEIRSVVESHVSEARMRIAEQMRQRIETENAYAALPFDEISGSSTPEQTARALRLRTARALRQRNAWTRDQMRRTA